jgi:serine/threonine protein kinase
MATTPPPVPSEIACPSCTKPFILQGRLGNYLLQKEAGRGGMGVVYKSIDEALQRTVAIKMLYVEGSANDDRVQELLQEARAAAAIRNPAVVDIYHFGTSGGHPYMVMEWMPGGSLQDRLVRRERLSELQVIDLATTILKGLEKCHENRLVHGDLKPGNILFDENGNAKLSDFGIAQFRGNDNVTGSQGTPYYVSPEKVKFDMEDMRSDLYSMGAILWHLLAGKPPFDAPTISETIRMRLTMPPPDLRKANPAITAETAQLVRRLLEPDPTKRLFNYQAINMHLHRARSAAAVAATRQRQGAAAAAVTEDQEAGKFLTTRRLKAFLTGLVGKK